MKKIEIEIDEEGKMKIKFQGFKGSLCFKEADKLYQLLKKLGIDPRIVETKKTQEAYVAEETKIYNNNV